MNFYKHLVAVLLSLMLFAPLAMAEEPAATAAPEATAPAGETAAPAVTESAAAPTTAPTLNSGDTAWRLTSTALVLFMTIPGLALFYAGKVRAKNELSVLMQCIAITSLITELWMMYGYSLAFDTGGMEKGVTNFNSFIGGLGKDFLSGVKLDNLTATIPDSVFKTFQMTFAIITPALNLGANAERKKISALMSIPA